jgi:TP53 regulating kinase-like protein
VERLIKKGAEADIWLKDWMGIAAIHKVRKRKEYMVKELDERLRKQRTLREAELISEAKKAGVPSPVVYFVSLASSTIVMEYISGMSLKDLLLARRSAKLWCIKLGRTIARLHKRGIIHGDPTTSNFIARGEDLVTIDFGLSFHSNELEDRAVDIHLTREVLMADDPENFYHNFRWIVSGYEEIYPDGGELLWRRVESIERRGRYARGQWG